LNQFQSLWDEGKTTMEPKLQGPQLIIFLSKDTELIAAVSERLATAGVALRGLPTLDALTADGCPTAGTTLVLDTRTLSEGQDIASLMDHVERHWGNRPTLACIAHSGAIEPRFRPYGPARTPSGSAP